MTTQTTAPKRKIVRRKPGDTSPKRYYFDEHTQDAIVRLQKETDPDIRELIYKNEINLAFKTLVDNLINVYKFQSGFESKEDLRNECVQFLYTIIMKFDESRGSKAFAYFNVVAKHWLTIMSKRNAKNAQVFVSIDNREALSAHDLETIEGHNFLPACDEVSSHEEFRENIKKILEHMKTKSRTPNEILCVDAISIILDSVEEIDLINKRAVLAYVRDITSLSPKQLSVVLSNLKKQYKDLRRNGEFVL